MSLASVCDTMLIGYVRVSKTDGSQSLDLQRDALATAAVDAVNVYHDLASGVPDDRPGSTPACAPCGTATCSSSASSTASAETSPTWSTPCRTSRLTV